MNGLKYIRTRCNLSLSELSQYIGVSRQIINAWELGTRGISKRNLSKLEKFFGIGGRYFGEISEEVQHDLLMKPMRLNRGGRHYTYLRPGEASDTEVYFPEMDRSLDEIYRDAVTAKKLVLNHVENSIMNPAAKSPLYVTSDIITAQCWFFESMAGLLDNKLKQKPGTMLAYTSDLRAMITVMLSAFGVEDIMEQMRDYPNFDPEDVEFFERIHDEVRQHLERKQREQPTRWEPATESDLKPDGKHYTEVRRIRRG